VIWKCYWSHLRRSISQVLHPAHPDFFWQKKKLTFWKKLKKNAFKTIIHVHVCVDEYNIGTCMRGWNWGILREGTET
jgi:hypothetical protein